MANRFLTPPKLTFPADASAEFNGTSDFIQTNNAFSHTKHTIAAWVYVEANTQNKFIQSFNKINIYYFINKKKIYYQRASGLINSMAGKKVSEMTSQDRELFDQEFHYGFAQKP